MIPGADQLCRENWDGRSVITNVHFSVGVQLATTDPLIHRTGANQNLCHIDIYIYHILCNSEIISVLYELYDKPGCYEDPFGSDASEDKTGSLRARASLHSSFCNSLPESTKPALPDLELRICHGQSRFVTVTATICHSHHPQEPRSDLKRFEASEMCEVWQVWQVNKYQHTGADYTRTCKDPRKVLLLLPLHFCL